jgi:hypothetical protein
MLFRLTGSTFPIDRRETQTMPLQTAFPFTLPRGYQDREGRLHREGVMRLATAMDEIEAWRHPRVVENEAYLPVALLSRVITQLGDLPAILPGIIEGLFASDLAFLEDLYQRINSPEPVIVETTCPSCSTRLQIEVAPLG